MRRIAFFLLILLSSATAAGAGETPAPADAKVYFVNLKDGDRVISPLVVRFGLSGMGIAPAGTEAPNTGHHHLFVDAPALEGDALNEAIPMDEHHMHFGKGQTETTLTLTPGKHTLQLIFADYLHQSFDPPLHSKKITITVE